MNAPGTEAKTNPYPCLKSMKLAMWTTAYLNFKCWKVDSARLSSFWDIASQIQKSGGVLIQAGVFIRRNTVSKIFMTKDTFFDEPVLFDREQLKYLLRRIWMRSCETSLQVLTWSILHHSSRPTHFSQRTSIRLNCQSNIDFTSPFLTCRSLEGSILIFYYI